MPEPDLKSLKNVYDEVIVSIKSDVLPSFETFKETYQKVLSNMQALSLEKIRNAFDAQVDGLYLGGSLLEYGQTISGHDLNFEKDLTFYFALALIIAFSMLGLTKAYAHLFDQKNVIDYYKKLRTVLSGVKNGHHSVSNIARLVGIFLNHSIAVSILSPAGFTAFSVGILLAINLMIQSQLQEDRKINLDNIKRYFKNNGQFLNIKAPSLAHHSKLMATGIIDGLTDGIYVVGNVLGLLMLCGVTAAIPHIAIPMAIAYGLYTFWSIINKIFKEKEDYLTEQFKYLDFLDRLNENNELLKYHNSKKNDQDYKNFIDFINDSTDIDKLRELLKTKRNQLIIEKYQLENNYFYKIYKEMIAGGLHISRTYSNFMKNSFAAVEGPAALVTRSSLATEAKSPEVLAIGLGVAILLGLYQAFTDYFKPKPNTEKPVNLNLLSALSDTDAKYDEQLKKKVLEKYSSYEVALSKLTDEIKYCSGEDYNELRIKIKNAINTLGYYYSITSKESSDVLKKSLGNNNNIEVYPFFKTHEQKAIQRCSIECA